MKQVVSDDSSPTSEHPAPDSGPGLASTGALPHSSLPSDAAQSAAVYSGTFPSEAPESDSRSRPSPLLAGAATGDIERDPTVISQRPIAVPADFTRSLSLIELARSLEGRHLHHFAVGRMIGGGGMGAVFRGRDLRLDREVAIKVIPESRRDPETLRRFRMEAQSAARLDHPNIARVYDIGEDEAWNYIVFEFIDGINLRDLVQLDGPMSIDDAVFTTRQVAEALQHAHDRDVVHRDIKPSNVIITPTGIAKVVDMGLARNTAMDRSAADQTASGVTLGTFDYISPEQARDPRDADVRSDLYSLGCTLFYMLTGQPPFPDGTALQKLLNHGSQPPPDPRQWRDDISDQLYAVLAKLMAKRPADRYQKPLELINDLLLIAQLEGLPRSRSPGSILMRPTIAQRTLLETHLPWLVPMSVLVISAFWLQSADSLTTALELPNPTFRSSQTAASPLSGRSDNSSELGRGADGDSQPRSAPVTPPRESQDASPTPPPPATSPATSESSRIVDPERADLLETGLTSPGSSAPHAAAAGAALGTEPGLVVPLAGQTPQVLDPTAGGASASAAARALSDLRNRLSSSQRTTPAPARADGSSELSAAGSGAPAGNTLGPLAAAATGASVTRSEPTGAQPSESSVEPRLPSPLVQDTIIVSAAEPAERSSSALWLTSLSDAFARAATLPEVRVIELRDSVELNHVLTIPRSGLTLRATPGKTVEIVLNGEQAYGMGWESWVEVQRVAFRCERIRFSCRNNMRQPQTIFALRAGGQLELVECWATMDSNHGAPLGSCVLVSEPGRPRERGAAPAGAAGASIDEASPAGLKPTSIPSAGSLAGEMPKLSDASTPATGSSSGNASGAAMPTAAMPAPAMPNAGMPSAGMPSAGMPSAAMPGAGMPGSGTTSAGMPNAGMPSAGSTKGNASSDAEPVAIALRGCVIRGNQNLVSMRTACRAEITLDETCAILEGRVLTIRGLEQDRMPPVVRLNMELSTLVCRQGFAAVQTGFALRAPLTLMRTAKLCAFWSPSLVPHITIDGIADQGVLDDLLQLRGEENAYDQNIATLCQCRFADGKHIDFSFRDAPGEWFRERGNDPSLRWQGMVPPDRPLEEQLPEDYRLRAGMFVPGFPPSATSTPRADADTPD